jgi:hypothetical protein
MMLERFASVRFFDVRLVTIARDAEDLVIVLRLAALERGLGTLKLPAECAHVAVRALELGLLERGAEVRDRVLVLLLVQPDACARAKRFEGAGLERERGFGVDEGVVVSRELPVTRRCVCVRCEGGIVTRNSLFGTHFDEGRGAVGEQQRAQLSALSFVLIFADPLAEPRINSVLMKGRCRRRGEGNAPRVHPCTVSAPPAACPT